MDTPTKNQLSPHAVIGVLLAIMGVLFTLDNLDLIDATNLLRFWPLAPIGVGLLILMQANAPAEWGGGIIWMVVGGLFLARTLGYLPFTPLALWPLMLVLVGLKLMWTKGGSGACGDPAARRMKHLERQRRRWAQRGGRYGHGPWAGPFGGSDPTSGSSRRDPWTGEWPHDPHSSFAPGSTPGATPGTGADADAGATVQPPPIPGLHDDDDERDGAEAGWDAEGTYGRAKTRSRRGDVPPPIPEVESRVTLFALMSGVTRKFKGIFRGGQLTAIMGGLELDLRAAQVDDVAVIDTLAFWGGIEIFVPEDWTVVNQGYAFMGGFEDSTRHPPPGERPRLIVRGLALMGGVEIKTKNPDSWWKKGK